MMGKRIRRLAREEDGLSLTEALLTLPVVLIVISAFVEFGFGLFQWSQTVKSLQLGARLAAVSDPVTDVSSLAADLSGGLPGDPAPGFDETDIVRCGGSGPACSETEAFNRLFYGSRIGTELYECDSNYGTRAPGICDFNPTLEPENIVITYARSGLGYTDRPGPASGLVMTITLETENHTFDLPLLGALLGVNTFEIPALPVTVTSEDLTKCREWDGTC
ncbi:MAG: pilus assembly protein [Alphaproteobacteria bacterium]|nr:pilus assembly protein [Alphaproteobacteria bacterium]